MQPRGRLDIAWSDLAYAIRCCLRPGDREAAQRRVEAIWATEPENLVSLSIRSGLDLLLQALDLPHGSEVLVSAITIHDMTEIIEHHNLVPVPVDMDMRTLSVQMDSLARAVTPRTKAILVAHLFGSRMPLDDVITFARQHGLLVIEDCAQAYAGPDYGGHPDSDACMFSFGPIKTNTALGGGIVTVRDHSILERMRTIQSAYPVQDRWKFMKRVWSYVGLKFLTIPTVFGAFAALCRLTGRNHDAVISAALRGFPGSGLINKIRHQPSYPLLALLERKLTSFDPDHIRRRTAIARTAVGLMPSVCYPGTESATHTFWVFPVQVSSPDDLMKHLWSRGFDATRGASSLYVLDPPRDRNDLVPQQARDAMKHVLYLPIHHGLAIPDLRRLAHEITSFLEIDERAVIER